MTMRDIEGTAESGEDQQNPEDVLLMKKNIKKNFSKISCRKDM